MGEAAIFISNRKMILTFFLLAEQTFSERLKIAPSRTLANVRNGDVPSQAGAKRT